MTTRRFITIAIDETNDMLDDEVTELIHRLIPGSHTLEVANIERAIASDFEWDPDDEPAYPLSEHEACKAADEHGYVTVIATVDQDDFRSACRATASGADSNEHDLIHQQVFESGLPYDSNIDILAATERDVVVSYTTDVVSSNAITGMSD